MSSCLIKFSLIFIVCITFYRLLSLIVPISELADMTIFYRSLTRTCIDHHLCRDVCIIICNRFAIYFFKLLFFLLVVAAIVCPNKCYLLTYMKTVFFTVDHRRMCAADKNFLIISQNLQAKPHTVSFYK
jgi:hypothetical protein